MVLETVEVLAKALEDQLEGESSLGSAWALASVKDWLLAYALETMSAALMDEEMELDAEDELARV